MLIKIKLGVSGNFTIVYLALKSTEESKGVNMGMGECSSILLFFLLFIIAIAVAIGISTSQLRDSS